MAARDESFNATTTGTPPPPPPPHSPWHSPVPYLFGGLAAMLGLIAFALLILACSYWKLSGYLENGTEGGEGERDLEAGEGKGDDEAQKVGAAVMEQKFLVIMAGELKPTFLATPMSSTKSSSFSKKNEQCCCSRKEEEKLEEEGEKQQVSDGDNQMQSQQSSSSQGQGH
ncbi:hypothetical protein PTKIN_Ptkin03bG0136600 [Pterospermum kingtungense]